MSRPDWTDYFISLARVVAKRSEDPKTQVGAVLVKDNRIVSTGYNGAPRGVVLPSDIWNSKDKHLYVLHAELNCILYANRDDARGADLYVTHSPCVECVKIIQAAGIDKVYYDKLYDPASLELFKNMEAYT